MRFKADPTYEQVLPCPNCEPDQVPPEINVARFVIHFPLGLFNAWLNKHAGFSGPTFTAGFLAYEFLENQACNDKSYKDVLGWLAGLTVGAICFRK